MTTNKSDFIYQDLKKKIINGAFDEDKILPTEKELETFYDASRNTVRKAIRQLNADGLIFSKVGSSNVVLERIEIPDLLIESGTIDQPSRIRQSTVRTKILRFELIQVDEELSRKSTFITGERVYHVIRLRYVNGIPSMIDDSFFRKKWIVPLDETIAAGSIYQYIKQKLRLRVVGSRLVDRIIPTTEIDEKYLDLDGMNCIGLTQNWSYLDSGDIFEYTEIHFAPKRYVRTRYINQT